MKLLTWLPDSSVLLPGSFFWDLSFIIDFFVTPNKVIRNETLDWFSF